MKKIICLTLLLLFTIPQSLFAVQATAKPVSCTETLSLAGIKRVAGLKEDGQKYHITNHCSDDVLVEVSCKGNTYKKTKTVCENGCDAEKAVCKSSSTTNPEGTDNTIDIETGGTLLFQYSTTAQRLALLEDFNILLNKVRLERGNISYMNEFDSIISNIHENIRDVVKLKQDFQYMQAHGYISTEELIQEKIERLTSLANRIADGLFDMNSNIKREINQLNELSRLDISNLPKITKKQIEFLKENDNLLLEKLKLLQELATLKAL